METKRLVGIKELAEVLNVKPSWLYQRTRRGMEFIPHIKVGKYVRFDTEEVIRFLKSGKQKLFCMLSVWEITCQGGGSYECKN